MEIVIILLAVFVLLIYPLMCINDAYWTYGKIPPFYPYSVKNEQFILLGLASLIIRRDFRDVKEKSEYINAYFYKYQGFTHFNSKVDFNESLRSPIKITQITDWLNKHISTPNKKKNIVQFMINVSLVDGELTGDEYSTLKYLNNLLHIPIQDFENMINIHLQQQEDQKKREQKVNSYKSESQKERSLKILGLAINADDAMIKKAYRTLVKENHPDRFVKDSALQQQLAQERFIEIQKAYEFLAN